MSGHQRVPDASDAVTSDYVEQASAAVLSLRPVAKLVQNTDRPNSNGSDADSDAECRVRTGDDPAHASADYSERNKIGEHRVPHRINPFRAELTYIPIDITRVQRSLFFGSR